MASGGRTIRSMGDLGKMKGNNVLSPNTKGLSNPCDAIAKHLQSAGSPNIPDIQPAGRQLTNLH